MTASGRLAFILLLAAACFRDQPPPALTATASSGETGDGTGGATDPVTSSTAGDHLVGLLSCTGMVVVTTPTTTMVAPLDQAERVRELVALVRAEAGERYV